METREIKYRTWNPRHKEFRYWGFVEGDFFTGIPTGAGLSLEECKKSDQSIGRKDANGKEIYDGDILKGHLPYENSKEYPLMIVEWNNEMAGFVASQINNGGCGGNLPVTWLIDATIIGNRFENPDLLTEYDLRRKEYDLQRKKYDLRRKKQ